MARGFQKSTDAIRCSTSIVTATPITIAVKFRIPNCSSTGGDGATHTLFMSRAAASDQGWYLELRTGGLLRAGARDGAGANTAESPSGYPIKDREWHWGFARFEVGDTNRFASLDVAAEGSASVAKVPAAQTNVLIGAGQGAGALYQNTGHEIEQVAVWTTSGFTLTDRREIVSGESPFGLFPSDLVAFVSLKDGEIHDYRGKLWDNEGSVAVVDDERRRRRYFLYGETAGATFNAARNSAANAVYQSGGMAA